MMALTNLENQMLTFAKESVIESQIELIHVPHAASLPRKSTVLEMKIASRVCNTTFRRSSRIPCLQTLSTAWSVVNTLTASLSSKSAAMIFNSIANSKFSMFMNLRDTQ